MRTALMAALLVGFGFLPVANAQEPAPAPAPAPEPTPLPEVAAKPKPPPYSLPWQLRPAVVGNVVRWDTAMASYEPPGSDSRGRTIASFLLASYKITDEMAPMIRLGVLSDDAPGDSAKVGLTNVAAGFTWAPKLHANLKLALFLGLAFPVASGGGNDPSRDAPPPIRGIYARSAMDNAMFAVNDFTVFPGVDIAWVSDGLTVQAEATLLRLTRVKGDDVQKDKGKTNFTSGLHVGYFLVPELSLGAELRYQRWLSTPAAVEADEAKPDAQQTGIRDTLSFAVGPRLHIKAGDKLWIRPGIAYARGLDNPMKDQEYNIVQVDIPVAF